MFKIKPLMFSWFRRLLFDIASGVSLSRVSTLSTSSKLSSLSTWDLKRSQGISRDFTSSQGILNIPSKCELPNLWKFAKMLRVQMYLIYRDQFLRLFYVYIFLSKMDPRDASASKKVILWLLKVICDWGFESNLGQRNNQRCAFSCSFWA